MLKFFVIVYIVSLVCDFITAIFNTFTEKYIDTDTDKTLSSFI